MAPDFSASSEFGPFQRAAFALAGTVALPSPFPASGRVSICLAPPAEESGQEPSFFLKSVQVVSEKKVVTRLVRLEDFRAARVYVGKRPANDPECWPMQTAQELAPLIEKKKATLRESLAQGGPLEIELFTERAILYVPEAAPVLHRVETATTAAESAESLASAPLCFFCEDEVGCPIDGEEGIDTDESDAIV